MLRELREKLASTWFAIRKKKKEKKKKKKMAVEIFNFDVKESMYYQFFIYF
jgi:hypothetical protein